MGIPDGVDGADGRELITHIIEKFAHLSKEVVCRQSAHRILNVINEKDTHFSNILEKLTIKDKQ